ncbi:MAG: hypothetical protein K6T66_14425 [Peptococcaceae bacterium]|nr:hypothetical protein [Peptococcaceae bacterium]
MTISRTVNGLLFRDCFDTDTLSVYYTGTGGTVVWENQAVRLGKTDGSDSGYMNLAAAYLNRQNAAMTGKFIFGSVSKSAQYLQLYLRYSATHWYRVSIKDGTTGGNTVLAEYYNGSLNSIAQASYTINRGVWYNFKFGQYYTTTTFKMWPEGEAEPASWLINSGFTDTATTGSARWFSYQIDSTIDNIGIYANNYTVKCHNLPAGYKFRVGTAVAAESGGTATVGVQHVTLPQSLVEVLDPSDAVVDSLTLADGVWGGDEYSYSASASQQGSSGADAVLQKPSQAEFQHDAVLRKPVLRSATAGSVLRKTVDCAAAADGVLKKTAGGISYIAGVLQKTIEPAHTADAVIKKRNTQGGFTADASVILEPKAQFAGNAALRKTATGSCTAVSALKKAVTGSLSAGAAVKATVSGSLTAQAVARKTVQSSLAASAVAGKTNITGSLKADAAIFKRVSSSFTADALIILVPAAAFTGNAVLRETATGSYTAACVLKKNVTGSFTADSVLAKYATASNIKAGAVIKKIPFQAASADAWLSKPAVTASFSADTVLKKTGQGSVDAAAVLKRSAQISFSASAVLSKAAQGGFTIDSRLLTTRTNTAAASSALKKYGTTGTFTGTAVLFKTAIGGANAQAVIRRELSAAFHPRAVLRKFDASNSLTAGAAFLKIRQYNFTVNAGLPARHAASFTADSYLVKTVLTSIAAGSVLFRNVWISFTADAHIWDLDRYLYDISLKVERSFAVKAAVARQSGYTLNVVRQADYDVSVGFSQGGG